MVILGMLLVLVGFAMIGSRGSLPGSTANRNVRVGTQLFSTSGYRGVPSRRFRLIQILAGVVVMAGGIVVIAMSA